MTEYIQENIHAINVNPDIQHYILDLAKDHSTTKRQRI